MLSTQKSVNQKSFDEGLPSDYLGFARLSYVKIFQASRTQSSKLTCRLKCVMLISVFIQNIGEIISNETESQESYICNQDNLTNIKEIQ